MKHLVALALAAVLFVPAAHADEVSGGPYRSLYGDYVSFAVDGATLATVSWGFESSAVRICMEDDSGRTYMRLGTVTTTEASSSTFTNGMAGTLAGSAASMFGQGDGTDVNCQTFPVAANAITFHTGSDTVSGTATLDVQVFGHPVR